MRNDLNEQYFEARKKHKENYSRKGYVIWILFAVGVLSFFIGKQILEKRKNKDSKGEIIQEFLNQGIISKSDTIFKSKHTGTSILILNNCLYKEFESSLGMVKNDSSGLGYVTARIVPNPDYKSSIQQWSKSIKLSDPSYEIFNSKRDSINGLVYETADIELEDDEQVPLRGKLKIIKKGPLYYVFQVSAYASTWDRMRNEIERVENSFHIMD